MKVVFVEPGLYAEILDIEQEMWQKTLNDYDQVFYPFDERVALLCNEEGKIPNRAIFDEGKLLDVIAGKFIVVGTTDTGFRELTDEEVDKYKLMFYFPERITTEGGVTTASKYGLF